MCVVDDQTDRTFNPTTLLEVADCVEGIGLVAFGFDL